MNNVVCTDGTKLKHHGLCRMFPKKIKYRLKNYKLNSVFKKITDSSTGWTNAEDIKYCHTKCIDLCQEYFPKKQVILDRTGDEENLRLVNTSTDFASAKCAKRCYEDWPIKDGEIDKYKWGLSKGSESVCSGGPSTCCGNCGDRWSHCANGRCGTGIYNSDKGCDDAAIQAVTGKPKSKLDDPVLEVADKDLSPWIVACAAVSCGAYGYSIFEGQYKSCSLSYNCDDGKKWRFGNTRFYIYIPLTSQPNTFTDNIDSIQMTDVNCCEYTRITKFLDTYDTNSSSIRDFIDTKCDATNGLIWAELNENQENYTIRNFTSSNVGENVKDGFYITKPLRSFTNDNNYVFSQHYNGKNYNNIVLSYNLCNLDIVKSGLCSLPQAEQCKRSDTNCKRAGKFSFPANNTDFNAIQNCPANCEVPTITENGYYDSSVKETSNFSVVSNINYTHSTHQTAYRGGGYADDPDNTIYYEMFL